MLPLPLRGTPTSQVASFVGMAARCDMRARLKGTRSDGVLTDTATIHRKPPTMPKSLSHLTVIIQSLDCAFWNISPAQNLPNRGFALVWE